jgi:asparagine synthase (glutamine-hydrolysing)
MFAFAIWDFENKELTIARDPFGQKPLFYHLDEKGLVFGSELNALIKHPWIEKELDRSTIAQYLVFDSYIGENSAIKNVKKLPPGSVIKYSQITGKLKKFKYLKQNKKVTDFYNYSEPQNFHFDKIHETLLSSVDRHLRTDVEIGAYLSGGIDSTLLAIAGSEILGKKFNTFTVRINEDSFNEADIASETAYLLGTKHHELTLSSNDIVNKVDNILNMLDEPIADLGLIAVSVAAEVAAKNVKVILSGDGSDEFFYGYEPFMKWKLSTYLDYLPKWFINRFLKPLIDKNANKFEYMNFFYKAQIFLNSYKLPNKLKNISWVSGYNNNEINNLLLDYPEFNKKSKLEDERYYLYKNIYALDKEKESLNELDALGLEYQSYYLSGQICSHTDKSTMMKSIEGRSPFLDKEMIELANNIPSNWKVKNGQGKWILRQLIKKKLPNSNVFNLPKHGYTIPIAKWMNSDLRDFTNDTLHSNNIKKHNIFNSNIVTSLLSEHQSGKRNNYKKLWPIIVLTNWINNNNLT